MNQNPTGDRQPVENLAVGDHISDSAGVHRVVHHLGFRDGDGRPMCAVTLQPLDKGQPWLAKAHKGMPFRLATEDEICEFMDARRRAQMHDDLVAIQGLLGSLAVRPSAIQTQPLDLYVVEGEVSRLAEKLALPLQPFGGAASTERFVEWTAPGGEELGQRLRVRFWGRPAAPFEETDQDWYFTFPEGSQYAGRYVRLNGMKDAAAARMNRIFGHAWAEQFTSDAGTSGWSITELPPEEWPPASEPTAFLPTRDEQQGR